jgi:Calcineurin-like phosphoesterase
MKRLAWITDVHLNFLTAEGVEDFFRTLAETDVDAMLLSGDLGEAPDVALHLNALDTWLGRPIYFVLGNHDFYRGSITGVRAKIEALCAAYPDLHWLPRTGLGQLTEKTGLVGHDGWGDGRLGDYWGSPVLLNDWRLIEEFQGLNPEARLARLHALGDEAAAHLRAVLPEALERFRNVLVLTHVPPFREACWHEGRISDDSWLPHFTGKAVGDALAEAGAAPPDRQITVLCGHKVQVTKRTRSGWRLSPLLAMSLMSCICFLKVTGSITCPFPGAIRLIIWRPSRAIAWPIRTCAWKNTSFSPMQAIAGTTPALAA